MTTGTMKRDSAFALDGRAHESAFTISCVPREDDLPRKVIHDSNQQSRRMLLASYRFSQRKPIIIFANLSATSSTCRTAAG